MPHSSAGADMKEGVAHRQTDLECQNSKVIREGFYKVRLTLAADLRLESN
jgi:hypothetical protein